MKSITIQAKRFELEEQMHRFVSAYLQRTANFVAKNQIDEELHQDILQRLADKLSDLQSQGRLDQKYIIQTINDLGEAEDIFAEELDFQLPEPSFQKEEKSLTFYERLQAKGRSRPQQKALFLGIYAMIADLIGWNVRMVRGIGLFLHFAFSAMGFFGVEILLSVPMYFALALILPRKEKDYYHRSVLNYFLTQVRDLRLLVINFFRKVWQLLCFLMPTK